MCWASTSTHQRIMSAPRCARRCQQAACIPTMAVMSTWRSDSSPPGTCSSNVLGQSHEPAQAGDVRNLLGRSADRCARYERDDEDLSELSDGSGKCRLVRIARRSAYFEYAARIHGGVSVSEYPADRARGGARSARGFVTEPERRACVLERSRLPFRFRGSGRGSAASRHNSRMDQRRKPEGVPRRSRLPHSAVRSRRTTDHKTRRSRRGEGRGSRERHPGKAVEACCVTARSWAFSTESVALTPLPNVVHSKTTWRVANKGTRMISASWCHRRGRHCR